MIVALDGPAGSGKSTTARRVAHELGGLYLDTGAMYRAIGLAFLDHGTPFTEVAAANFVPGLRVELDPKPDASLAVRLGGKDVTERIRSGPAAQAASRAAALAPVRTAMLHAQRAVAQEWADTGRAVVAEGRDMGSVVFPDAPVKFFLTADLEARAQRRAADLAARGEDADVDRVRDEIAQRDRRDADRALAPLRAAPDAVVLDTTALTPDEQVERVVQAVRAAQAQNA
ncbi:MAG: (d)CMP kinase [Bacteroidota bacterium]